MFLALASLALAADPEIHAEATSQLLPRTVALDLRGRVDGERDAYLSGIVRVDPTGAWVGRAGIGFDVFGRGDGLDLKLGLFLGGVGDFADPAMYGRPAAGAEVLLGVRFGRVFGSFRHVDGFAGPLEDRLTEDELRLGFRITDHVRVHGQYLVYDPGATDPRGGAGIGAEVVF